MIIKVIVALFVFPLIFASSFFIASSYFDNKLYYETLDKLLEHEDILENALLTDLQSTLITIKNDEVGNISGDIDICGSEFNQ